MPHSSSGRRALRLSGLVMAMIAILTVVAPATSAHPRRSLSWRAWGDTSSAAVRDLHWTSASSTRGLTVLSGSFVNAGSPLHWTVTIQAPTRSPYDGTQEYEEAGPADWAQTTETALQADGFSVHSTPLPWPDYPEVPRGVMGTRVRVGEFDTKADAVNAAATLSADGFHPAVEWEGFDPDQTPDAEHVHAAIIDLHRFRGRVIAYHGSAVASRQTVAAHAQQLGSLVAVNGGFFTIASPLTDVAGVPTGLGVYGGKLETLSNDSRADLLLSGAHHAAIANLHATAQLRAPDGVRPITGLNREPGSAEDCGVPGLLPTSDPRQGLICSGPDDLILFTPEFGAPLPSGPGVQATLDSDGRVLALGVRGGTVPAGGAAIQAIGADAQWVSAHLRPGERVAVDEQLRLPDGSAFPLRPNTSIASAAPLLLQGGREYIDAVREGVFDPRDENNYGFSAERHARTIAGVGRHGKLLLVTVDGIPGVSEGYTLSEEAELMRALGAVDAMNLDGGGSTTFVVGGATINQPSDATGPRPIGDSIQVLP